jgi:hypothetical protein
VVVHSFQQVDVDNQFDYNNCLMLLVDNRNCMVVARNGLSLDTLDVVALECAVVALECAVVDALSCAVVVDNNCCYNSCAF